MRLGEGWTPDAKDEVLVRGLGLGFGSQLEVGTLQVSACAVADKDIDCVPACSRILHLVASLVLAPWHACRAMRRDVCPSCRCCLSSDRSPILASHLHTSHLPYRISHIPFRVYYNSPSPNRVPYLFSSDSNRISYPCRIALAHLHICISAHIHVQSAAILHGPYE